MKRALAPRKPPTSMTDVATLAGVSVATVSNTLNNPAIVAETTRNRIYEAIEKLGWVRNESARQLRAGRSRFIGTVVIDISNPFFTDVIAGAETAAAKAGYAVLLANSAYQPDREGMHLDIFKQQRVRGILLAPIWDIAEKVRDLQRFGIPVVLVDRHNDMRDLCTVSVDDVAGGQMAVEHLIERGHRRIAFVGGPASLPQVRDRLDGAERAFQIHRLSPRALQVVTTDEGLDVALGRWAVQPIISTPAERRATAVFAANDLVSIGLLQGFIAQGFRVPNDFAIIGYDDIDYAATSAVPLSSIQQPRTDLGRRAAELLLEEIQAMEDGRAHRHEHVRFAPKLIVRASSQPSRAEGLRGRKSPAQSTASTRAN